MVLSWQCSKKRVHYIDEILPDCPSCPLRKRVEWYANFEVHHQFGRNVSPPHHIQLAATIVPLDYPDLREKLSKTKAIAQYSQSHLEVSRAFAPVQSFDIFVSNSLATCCCCLVHSLAVCVHGAV